MELKELLIDVHDVVFVGTFCSSFIQPESRSEVVLSLTDQLQITI